MRGLRFNCETGQVEEVELTEEELAVIQIPESTDVLLGNIRAARNQLLSQCDWTQLPDSPLTDEQKQAWRDYRQALRDLPDMCDPNNPVWPIAPT